MTDSLLRVMILVSIGLGAVLLVRRPVRRLFGAGPAFTLWALPWLLAAAPWLPLPYHTLAPRLLRQVLIVPVAPSGAVDPGTIAHAAQVNWLLPALLTLWLVGALACVIRFARQYARLRHGVRALPEALRDALRPLCSASDLCRLRVHVEGPAVFWAPRTRVLLPPDFLTRFDAGARAMVLRHELAHAHRGDAWWTLGGELTHALLWFHPLAWWALPRFRLDMELACDERALRASPDGHAAYGRTLLASAAARPRPTLIPWLTAPQLKARIAMISRLAPGRWRRATGLATIVAMAAGGLLASGIVMGTPRGHAILAGTSGIDVAPSISFAPDSGNIYPIPEPGHKKGEHGKVVLYVTGIATGRVTDVRMDRKDSTAPIDLQKATAQVAWKWKITPGREDGKPVGGTVKAVSYHVLPSDRIPCEKPSNNSKVPHRCYSFDHDKRSSASHAPSAMSRKSPRTTRTRTPPPMLMPLLIPRASARTAVPNAG